ncbi:hypothetical protein G6F27_014365 [Rhizopus arrhizus]|nr:hypothetical protein G6F27_014365 [Rhizopus arrhizus]
MLAAAPLNDLPASCACFFRFKKSDVAQSTPATTSDMEPEPLDFRTLTATGSAFLATPYFLPAIVPAQ